MQTDSVLLIELGREALAVARSLGRAGFHVIVGNSGTTSIVESSRYCHEVWRHPPIENCVILESALVMFLDSRPDIRFIFPVGERAPVAISSMRKILERDVILVMVHSPLLEECLNKTKANDMAMGLDFNVPKFSEVQSLHEIQTFIDEAGFPIIVKPCRSSKKIFGRKAYILSSQEELETVFSAWPIYHRRLIVQQYIQGNVEACDFVASSGKLLGYMETLSIRTDKPDGTGFAIDFYSIPVSPDVYLACRVFVQTYRYSGAGLIQFIRSKDDNKLYFVEINPRLSAGISHPIACGQDFPLLTLQAFSVEIGDEFPEFADLDTPYNIHQRAHWLQGDIEGLLAERRNLSLKGKLMWFFKIAISFVRADSHMNWQLTDPLPSFKLYFRLIFRVCKRLASQRN
ncbi:MAG: ATP-grasp domain-containing protein [Oceanicoccus sp.]